MAMTAAQKATWNAVLQQRQNKLNRKRREAAETPPPDPE